MLASGKHEIFADYYQFYLWDRDANPMAPEDYNDDDILKRIKLGPNVVVIQPVRNMDVPFEIEIHAQEPDFDPSKWDHIAECGLDVRSGNLQIHECTGGPVGDYSIPSAHYRVRVFFGKLDQLSEDQLEGDDHYKAVLWPAKDAELKVIKQWTGRH